MGDQGSVPVDPDVSVFDVPPAPQRTWDIVIVIAAGGALGGAARYVLNHLVPSSGFPWPTFVENVTGCFLLGVLMVYLLDVWPPNRYLRPFLGVGVLGGFTTFSAYTVETRVLLADGRGAAAMAYMFGTLLAGLTGTWLGITAARAMTKEAR